MRHASIEITQSVYVHEGNRLIQKALAADHPTQQNGGVSHANSFVFESGEGFRDWALNVVGLDPDVSYRVNEVAELLEARRLHDIEQASGGPDTFGMDEDRAFALLERNGVETVKAMRSYFLAHDGARKEGARYVYSELKVRRFADDHVQARSVWQEARKSGRGYSEITYKRRLHDLDCVKMGRIYFVRREDAAKLR